MYTITSRKPGIDSIAIGPNGLIEMIGGKISVPLENIDFQRYLKNPNKPIEMQQVGPNLLSFYQSEEESVIYHLKNKAVVFSSIDQPLQYNTTYGDLSAKGYVLAYVLVDDAREQRLVDIATGSVKEIKQRVSWISTCRNFIFNRSWKDDRISRLDFDGNVLWTLFCEPGVVKSRHGKINDKPNKLSPPIDVYNGGLWYQENSGEIKVANIDTGVLELTIGAEESILPSWAIQREGEELYGTYHYRFSKDKKRLFGMGGSLYTEINLTENVMQRRVYDCRDSTLKHGISLSNRAFSNTEVDSKLIFLDTRGGRIGAFDRDIKEIVWAMDLFPEGEGEFILNMLEYEDQLYVLTRADHNNTKTLITLQREIT